MKAPSLSFAAVEEQQSTFSRMKHENEQAKQKLAQIEELTKQLRQLEEQERQLAECEANAKRIAEQLEQRVREAELQARSHSSIFENLQHEYEHTLQMVAQARQINANTIDSANNYATAARLLQEQSRQ